MRKDFQITSVSEKGTPGKAILWSVVRPAGENTEKNRGWLPFPWGGDDDC